VFVVKEGDDYKIVLNDDGLPKLRISPTYKRMLDVKEVGSEETRNYVKEKLRSALWLLKSVDQRQRTIYKVADSIVRHQRGFLDHGVGHLRPLVLRDVATDIGMHESTVSRVVANKYMHTPRGVYEMRYFFHSGITSSMGESISSVTIKEKIRKLIDAEDASHPMSDSRIADILENDGLPLARRTVAKYREELRIPPSNLRKAVH
jgi:RNA polymerase sigma-54 factor